MTPPTITSNSKIQIGVALAIFGGLLTIVGMVYRMSSDFVTKELFQAELGAMRRESFLQFDSLNRRISDLSTALDPSRQKQ